MSDARPRNAFGLSALLVLTTLGAVFLAPTALADENGTLVVQALDEDDPLTVGADAITDMFGIRAAALVNVTDADLVEPQITVLVTSDSDPTGEDLRLQRMGLFNIGGQPTPVYHAILAVEATRVAGNGLIHVTDGDTISLVYIDDKDTGGQTVVRQAFVTWHQTHQGSISLGTGTFAGTDTQADVVVNDLDFTTPTITVNVTSDSQGKPSSLTLSKVTDGRYAGKLDFSPVDDPLNPDDDEVEVANGDRFTVYYRNYGPTGDEQNITASGTWRDSYTGRVQFVTSDYRTVISEQTTVAAGDTDFAVYGEATASTAALAGAWLRVEDPDRRGHGSITVQVGSLKPSGPQTNVDPTGLTIVLTETGTATGEFTGYIGFIRGVPSAGSRLRVDVGAVIEARYTDPKDEGGFNNVLIKTQAAWIARHDGTAMFTTTPGGTTAAAEYNVKWEATGCSGNPCIPGLAHLRVVDADLDIQPATPDTVKVRLVSSDTVSPGVTVLRDARGIEVELTETSASSGIFTGTVQFNHSYSYPVPTAHPAGGTHPTIWALCEDNLQLIYVDAAGKDNQPGLVTTTVPIAGSQSGCSLTTPPVPTGANAPTVKLQATAGAAAAATSFTGRSTPTVPVVVHVELRDVQLNQNTAVAETNDFRLYASTTQTFPAAWVVPTHPNAPIRNATTHMTNMSVRLTETGISTGIFRGSFELVAPGNEAAGAVPKVPVDVPGEQICVAWPHTNATGKLDTVLRSCATWNAVTTPATASNPEFRRALDQGAPVGAFFDGQGRAYVFVRDTDMFADLTNRDNQVSVNIRSDSDTTGINVVLTERYGHHYMHMDVLDDPCVFTFGGGSGCPNPVADSDVDDRGFLGTFNFTLGPSNDITDTLRVKDGDTVTVFYADNAAPGGAVSTIAHLTWNQTYTGTLSIDKSELRVKSGAGDPANFIEITVNDRDGNVTAGLDAILVSAANPRGGQTAVQLFETDPHSGVFTGKFELCRTPGCTTTAPAPANAMLEFKDLDTITVTYRDAHDASGAERFLHATALARNVTGGKLTLDQVRYTGYGAVGGIFLEDKDLDTSSNRDEVRVFAWSTSDATGEYIVLRETAATSGLFEGGFGFEAPGGDVAGKRGNGALMVQGNDRVVVYYLDRNVDGAAVVGPDEPARKVASATWTLTANVGPVLGLSTEPPAAAGNLTVAPGTSVTFFLNATDNDGQVTAWSLSFGDGTASATGTGAVPTGGILHAYQTNGTYLVRFNATDDEGLVATTTMTIRVAIPDNDPPGPVTSLTADQIRADSVRLTWTAPQNNAGASDGTKVTGYQIRRSSGPITTDAEWNAALPATATFDPVTLATPGTLQQSIVLGLSPATTYTLAVRATDTQNLGPIRTISVTTLVQDDTPPLGVPEISSSHQRGVASSVRNVTFLWTEVTDEESSVSYRYKWNTQSGQTVLPTDTPTTQTSITFPGVSDGRYYFHLAACSAGGTLCGSTVTYGPVIIEGPTAGPTPTQIQDANSKVQLRVTRDDGDNVIRWTVPTNTPFPVAGVQIWRSTSPYTLLQTFEVGDPEFSAGEFTDVGAPANATYKVTVFYVVGNQRYGYAESDPSGIPGFDSLPDTGSARAASEGLEWYWIASIALGALLLIAIAMVLVVALRQKGEPEEWPEDEEPWPGEQMQEGLPAEEAWPEEAWPEEAPAEPEPEPWEEEVQDGLPVPEEARAETAASALDHLLTCPHCQTEFIATGAKPLVTQCPSCGVKGVLR